MWLGDRSVTGIVTPMELQPKFNVLGLLNLPNHDIYLKLMIDGVPSTPFSGIGAPFAPSESR